METGINISKLRKKYDRLEDNNDHTGAANLVVNAFGTDEDKEIMKGITERHEKNGHIIPADYHKRYEVSQKYYKILQGL